MLRRGGARGALAIAVLGGVLFTWSTPAAADPPGPTDYRSEVTGLVPDLPDVSAEVLGGDSFLLLEVDRGLEVIVEGYSGEPYLRFGADGVVEANQRSEATYINEDRYAEVQVPPEVDSDADPVWEEVADGGSYAWHDHRIHWMSPSRAPTVEDVGGERLVQEWRVPLLVAGEEAAIEGRLLLEDQVPSWLHLGASVVVAALVWAVGRRRQVLVGAVSMLVASVVALVVGWADWTAVPTYVRISPLAVILPAVALAASVLALAVRRPPAPVVGILAAAASLAGWALTRASVLFSAVLPTDLPFPVDRWGTVVVLGASVGAAVLAVLSGELLPPDREPFSPQRSPR